MIVMHLITLLSPYLFSQILQAQPLILGRYSDVCAECIGRPYRLTINAKIDGNIAPYYLKF